MGTEDLIPKGSKLIRSDQIRSVAQLCPTLRPHESQHARPPCPSPTPGVHWDSRPSSQWCHPAISSSVVPFSCPQALPAPESFPMSQLFAWGGQSTGVSALASFLSKKSGLISFRMDWLDLLAVQGTLKSLIQHHSSKASWQGKPGAGFIGNLSNIFSILLWTLSCSFHTVHGILIFLGSKITADGDCSHEIKRCLLLRRKVMTNLDSILKSRDITLSTKVHIVKAMVFPVVTYGYESWNIKKAKSQRTMLLNCGVGKDSWEYLVLQGDQTS